MPTIFIPTVTGRRARATLAIVAAFAAALPALARGAGAGVARAYVGKTAQGMVVRLSRPQSFGRSFTYRALLRCSDGTSFTDAPFVDDVSIRKGAFHVRFKSDHGAVITDVKGSIKGRRASGTIKIDEHYSATPDANGNTPLSPTGTTLCASGVVRWSARA